MTEALHDQVRTKAKTRKFFELITGHATCSVL